MQNTDGLQILTAKVTKNKIAKTSKIYLNKFARYFGLQSKPSNSVNVSGSTADLSFLNHHKLSNPTPVSPVHFNQPGHSINDVCLIPLELIRSKRNSVRKAREAHLIIKARPLHTFGINRRDEARQCHISHL